jgi:hypothetical protein
MANKDDWTILRQNLRSVSEMIELIEETRIVTGLDAFFCPIVEFLRGCPDVTIADTIRAMTFLLVHPKWGIQYCSHLILHSGVNQNRLITAVIQRNAVDAMLTLDEQTVVRTLQLLLRKPKLQFESWDAVNDIVQWLLVHESDAVAFLSQPDVIRHIPNDIEISDGVFGTKELRRMKAYGDGAMDIDIDLPKMRDIAMKGNTAVWKWLREQSATGDQTKYSDINPSIAWTAIKRIAQNAGLQCAAYDNPDPSAALSEIMEELYGHHCSTPDADEDYRYIASLTAFMIADYKLHDCADRAFSIHHTVNKYYGLPHQAPDTVPAPR